MATASLFSTMRRTMRTLMRRGAPTVTALTFLMSEPALAEGPQKGPMPSGSAGRVHEDHPSNLDSAEDSAGGLFEPAHDLVSRVPLADLVSAGWPLSLTVEEKALSNLPRHQLQCSMTSEYGSFWDTAGSKVTARIGCNVCQKPIFHREVVDNALAIACTPCSIQLCREFGTHGLLDSKPATFTKLLTCCPNNTLTTRASGTNSAASRRAAGQRTSGECQSLSSAEQKQRQLELHGCRTRKELSRLMGWASSPGYARGVEHLVMCQLPMVAIERMPRNLSTWALAWLFRHQLDVHGARVAAAVAAVEEPEVAMFDVEKLQLHRLPGDLSLEDVATIKEYNPRLTTETFVGMVSTETASPVGAALVDELPEPGSFALSERQVQLEHDALVALRNRTTSSGAPVTLFHWNGDEGARCDDAGYVAHIDACHVWQQFLGLGGGSYEGKLPSFEGEVLAYSCAQNVVSRCVEGVHPSHSARGDCQTTPPTFLGRDKLLDIASQLAEFDGEFEDHPKMREARKRLLTEIKLPAVIQEAAKRKDIFQEWLAACEKREAEREAEGQESRKSAKSGEGVKVQATGDPWSKSKSK